MFQEPSTPHPWWGQIRKHAATKIRLLAQRVLGRHYSRVKAVLKPGP
jgi:hypothetical protein